MIEIHKISIIYSITRTVKAKLCGGAAELYIFLNYPNFKLYA